MSLQTRFAALLIAVLALAPSLDKLVCRDEAPLAVAEASLDGIHVFFLP